MRLFALDQNFPQPIIEALRPYMTEAELVAVADIDPRLAELDDWELLLALHHHERDWDGLITTDSGMLSMPLELCVLMQTGLTLVVADAAGHDPLKATGLILAYLPWIAAHTEAARAQLWVLRTANRPNDDPWDWLTKVAERHDTTASSLYDSSKLTERELRADPLA